MPHFRLLSATGEIPETILQALKEDGLVAVHGGRLEVREKIKEVQSIIEEEGLKDYWANSTINHPDTELGYGYDANRYSSKQARINVVNEYEKSIV